MRIFVILFFLFFVNSQTAQSAYCIPNPSGGVNGYSISHFHLQSLDTSAVGNSTYNNFRDSLHHLTCYLEPGTTYKLFLTSGTQTVSTCAAWIDWNNDSTFNSLTEKLGEFTTSSSNQYDSIIFTVPLNCYKGKTRLRIRCSDSSSMIACANYQNGQTTDFTITAMNSYDNSFYQGWEYSRSDSGYIDGVKIGSINNQNTGNINGPVYNDYSYLTTNISACSNNNLIVKTFFTTPGNGSVTIRALIDYNNNGVFENISGIYNEQLPPKSSVVSGSRTDTFLINTPNSTGLHRLRIIAERNGKIKEAEDYLVNIQNSGTSSTLTASFSSDLNYVCPAACDYEGCAGHHSFSDNTCGNPSSRNWMVKRQGVAYDSSVAQNPTFNFITGNYTVELTVTNSFGTDIIQRDVKIFSPNFSFSLGNDTLVCSSGSFKLSAPFANHTTQCYKYRWNTNQNDSVIYIHSGGTYGVTIFNCDYSGCPPSDSIVVTLSPEPYNVTGGGNYCSGGSGLNIGLDDTQNGITYRLYRDGNPVGSNVSGTGNSISFGNQTIAGTYTVVATNNAISCTAAMNGTAIITVNPLPIAYNVTGGGQYCSGANGLSIGISNSQTGVSYELYRNGNPTGVTITGTGSAINFPNQTLAATYTTVGTDTSTLCTKTMNGNANISILPLPIVYNVTGGGSFCANVPGVPIGLNLSQNGATYTLFRNGNSTGITINGTGSAINFANQALAGTYTVVATSQSCTVSMSGNAPVSVSPLPNVYNVMGGGHYCYGSNGAAVLLSGSDPGIQYQLHFNGSPLGNWIPGNGIIVNFGGQTQIGTYSIVASDINTACTSNMNDSVTVSIDSLPHVQIITTFPNIVCIYDSPILLQGNPAGGTFYGNGINNNTLDPSIAGAGTDTITYTYTDTNTTCSASAIDSVHIDLCTGVNENNFHNSLSLFPNPANEEILIGLNEIKDQLQSIDLINGSGQLVETISIFSHPNQSTISVRTSHLAGGIYIVKFNFEGNFLTGRIQIIH